MAWFTALSRAVWENHAVTLTQPRRAVLGGPSPSFSILGLIALARPKQWSKNVLVAAAPLAAGALLQPATIAWTAIAFVCFCLAASSVYMINDVLDVNEDRAHPKKRFRPVASGQVSPRVATVAAGIAALSATVIPAALGNAALAGVIGSYLVLQALYVWRLKHEAVFDIACVAAGFLLRAIAGGVASGVIISNPFLVVVGFGALFIAVGKRYSEILSHKQEDKKTRKALDQYTPGYLRILLSISATVSLVGYILWAFEIDARNTNDFPIAALSIIPFTLALMRYAKDVDSAEVEAPEDALFADKGLLILGVLWLGLFVGQVLQR